MLDSFYFYRASSFTVSRGCGTYSKMYKYKSSNGKQKDEVCFLDFNIFRRSAEIANQYLRKGSKVLLERRLIFE